jgi:altronate dehydratase
MHLGGDHAKNLTRANAAVDELLAIANQTPRTTQPIRHLKIGMQCGGSDAFSGVSANPLVGIIARETVRHGGAANLAETDELMGAEPWVLAKVRDLATAQNFLQTLATFEEKLNWHGASGQSNPSGGNMPSTSPPFAAVSANALDTRRPSFGVNGGRRQTQRQRRNRIA